MLGSPDLDKAGKQPVANVAVSQNVRPGVVIVVVDNQLVYDGPPADIPAGVMAQDCAVLVHPHFKAQIDAKAKQAAKTRRLLEKKEARRNG